LYASKELEIPEGKLVIITSPLVEESTWNVAPGLFALNFRKVLEGKLTVLFPVRVPSEL
jgi:hypothetical protein